MYTHIGTYMYGERQRMLVVCSSYVFYRVAVNAELAILTYCS